TDFDECLVNIHAVVSIVVSIATKADEAAKCAKLSLGASVVLDLTAGNCVPVRRTGGVATEVNLETCVTANFQASLSTWDVEIASAECVANANIFNSFWFCCNDCVSCICARETCESCCGANQYTLDLH